jgi:hypothetical protein
MFGRRPTNHQKCQTLKPLFVLYFITFYSARQSPNSIANLLKWPFALYHKKTREADDFTGLEVD